MGVTEHAAAATALMASLIAGSALAQPSAQVQVEHAAARLVVIAEPRGDISVTVQHGPSRLPPLAVRRDGGRIVVDGGLEGWGRHLDCAGGMTINTVLHVFGHAVTHVRDSRGVSVGGIGRVEYADLPLITAHVPLDARIATGGAVWGEIGSTRSLALQTTGCGDWTAGRVRGALGVQAVGSGDVRAADVGIAHVQLSGSGDVSMGQVAGGADVALNGSGDVQTGPVGGPLQVALSGSGDVTVAGVNAPVRAQIASSGDVRIHGGRAPQVQVNVSGSGDFDFGGEAGSLQASVAGSGDVHVARVDGPVSKSVVGSGEVTVGP